MKIIAASIVALLGLLIWASYEDAKRWEKFSAEHSCKLVAHSDGHYNTGYGLTTSGKFGMVTTYTDATNSYLCDDGITYTR
jgi:hypothetical protein